MKEALHRILLADDDETDRLLFLHAFKDLNMRTDVQVVNNGELLMEYLEKNEGTLPNIIFLDLNMPLKDGVQCLIDIKADQKYRDIAVAIYSTSATERDVEETFRRGANIYIQKPNDYNSLIKILKRVMTLAYNYQFPPLDRSNFLYRM